MKKSFILHLDSLEILEEMTLEQKGILFDAIYNFQKGNEVTLDFAMKMAFTPFKNQFIRDDEKYNEFKDKQTENGGKGGRPPKPKPNNETQNNPNNPSLLDETQKSLNVSDSVSVSVNESVSENVNKNDLKKKSEESEFSKNENYALPPSESVSENDNIPPKKEKKENAPQAGGAVEKKVWGEWKDGQGDGELHQLLADYFLNPNSPRYEVEEYRKFKAYWTAIVLVGNGKGKELWRTKQTFSISGRLSTWNGKATTFNQNKNHGTTSQLPNSRSKNNWNAEQVALDAIAIATAHLN